MSDKILVQYVGFEAKALVRKYTFAVQEATGERREFTLTIANEAFKSHRARYQDAPDICSLRLHRELATHADHPPKTHFCVTDAELADYHNARTQKPLRSFHTPKAD